MDAKVIDVQNLRKYYGKHRGIEDVTFSVKEGEIYGFIGPNGAGKSTTIRTLLALIRPTGGRASIFGKDCIKQAPDIAQDVGYLPSESAYYENMRVRELLRYTAALYGTDCGEKTAELCERLRLDTGRKIADLSFGNRKKVGIVSALLHSPKLIILDEPTSGLDPLVQQTFFEILREENRRGATVLFSSHVLSEVQRMCGRVAIIKEGRIISIQEIGELRARGYKKVSLTASVLPENAFRDQSIANLQLTGKSASFLFTGAMGTLLEKLRNLDVTDLYIEEPTLEEIFLHYYR